MTDEQHPPKKVFEIGFPHRIPIVNRDKTPQKNSEILGCMVLILGVVAVILILAMLVFRQA
jgi:hypothetical protein